MLFSSHFGNLVFGCFCDNVTKILRNSLFIYHFSLACLALQTGKHRTENHETYITKMRKNEVTNMKRNEQKTQ